MKFNFFKIILLILLPILTFVSYYVKTSLSTNLEKARQNISYYQHKEVNAFAKNIEEHLLEKTTNTPLSMLKSSSELRDTIEDELSILMTQKYRYIFVVYKDDKNFRFLLDGSIEDKSEFNSIFLPEDMAVWKEVCHVKKPRIIEQTKINSLWKSYLYPIVIDDKAVAFIVIDFSAQEALKLTEIMDPIVNVATYMNIFLLVTLIITYIFVLLNLTLKKRVEETAEELKLLNESLEIRIEEAIKENQKKDKMLQQQSRLALMGEMISMIAHQWRQPLGAISASTFALQLKAVSPKLDFSKEEDRSVFITFLDETLDKVGENVQFLSTTIDDFRTFFQSDKKMQTVPFKEPLSRALKIVEASLQTHNIELIIDIKSERTILMYPNELMQVILNIIKNAEDVLMYNNIEEPKIKLVIHDTSDGVTLDIIDNGKGIEEKIIDHIFDPYFSTKDEKNGTGLGLYMSKMMIEDHNHGTLEVRNIDDGVCFSITLKAS